MPVPQARTASNSGSSTPLSSGDKDILESPTPAHIGKPDKAAHDAEQERFKADIEIIQGKLSTVKDKISLATRQTSGNDRRTALRAELDTIRAQQAVYKTTRTKTNDQVRFIQDDIKKKIKDLQAAKAKIPFKSTAEIDAFVRNLEKQVESGNMKLAEEKRALSDISAAKRNRRIVESFQAEQEAIETSRSTLEDLRKQLDDPDFKAVSDRFDAVRAELAELKREEDEAYANRSKLFAERDGLQAELNQLYNQKRQSGQRYREQNDLYWAKVKEDRARRAERARAQRAAEEAQKKKETAERLLEDARIPAFQTYIEDCQTLIDHFSGKTTVSSTQASLASTKAELAGVPKLEIRKVDDAPEGAIVRKKSDEEAYFVVSKTKSKGKRGPAKTSDAPSAVKESLNIPLPILSALLTLSIPPPASSADVPRVIEDLRTKKAWYEANQERATAENVAKAEAEIQRLANNASKRQEDDSTGTTTPVRDGENPAEPAPSVTTALSASVPTSPLDDKLEAVHGQETEAEQ